VPSQEVGHLQALTTRNLHLLEHNSALPSRYHNAIILRRNNSPGLPAINLAKFGSMNL
jgi:hypothetical protein